MKENKNQSIHPKEEKHQETEGKKRKKTSLKKMRKHLKLLNSIHLASSSLFPCVDMRGCYHHFFYHRFSFEKFSRI